MRTIIDIEGLDGSGKNTQFNLLIEKLKNDIIYKKNKIAIVPIAFPNYDNIDGSYFIKKVLNGNFPKIDNYWNLLENSKYSEAIGFIMDRYYMFFQKMKDNCLELITNTEDFNYNKIKEFSLIEFYHNYKKFGFDVLIILCDRYIFSNLVYISSSLIYSYRKNNMISINENIIEDEIKIIEKFSIFDIELEKNIGIPTNFHTFFLDVDISLTYENLIKRYNGDLEKLDVNENNRELQVIARMVSRYLLKDNEDCIINCMNQSKLLKSKDEIHNLLNEKIKSNSILGTVL